MSACRQGIVPQRARVTPGGAFLISSIISHRKGSRRGHSEARLGAWCGVSIGRKEKGGRVAPHPPEISACLPHRSMKTGPIDNGKDNADAFRYQRRSGLWGQ